MLWITSQSERTVSPKMNWPFSLLAIDELKINLKSITEMLENYVLGRWPMAAHILQVAYYDTLRELRVKMLEAAGYQVTSVSGNDNAMGLDGAVIAGANLIVVLSILFGLRWFFGSKRTTPKFRSSSCSSAVGRSSLRPTCLPSLKTPRSG